MVGRSEGSLPRTEQTGKGLPSSFTQLTAWARTPTTKHHTADRPRSRTPGPMRDFRDSPGSANTSQCFVSHVHVYFFHRLFVFQPHLPHFGAGQGTVFKVLPRNTVAVRQVHHHTRASSQSLPQAWKAFRFLL